MPRKHCKLLKTKWYTKFVQMLQTVEVYTIYLYILAQNEFPSLLLLGICSFWVGDKCSYGFVIVNPVK